MQFCKHRGAFAVENHDRSWAMGGAVGLEQLTDDVRWLKSRVRLHDRYLYMALGMAALATGGCALVGTAAAIWGAIK